MLAHALALVVRGFRIHPLHDISSGECSCALGPRCPDSKQGKHPRLNDWVKDASDDPDQVQTWWAKWPKANIGILCGNGLYVLDVDPKNGGDESLERLGSLPRTFMVATPTGGRHFYFKTDLGLRNSAGKLGRGLDTRGEGGFIVGPGSVRKMGAYKIVCDEPFAELPGRLKPEPKPKKPAAAIELPIREGIPDRYVAAAVNGELAKFSGAVEGERNHQLFKTTARLGEFVAAGALDEVQIVDKLIDIAESIGLEPSEIQKTIASGLRAGEQNPVVLTERKLPARPAQGSASVPRIDKQMVQPPGHSTSIASCKAVLEDPALRALAMGKGELRFNEMTLKPEFDGIPVDDKFITDFRVQAERWIFGSTKEGNPKPVQFARDTAEQAISSYAADNRYHPVRDYLVGLQPASGAIEQMCDAMHIGEMALDRLLIRKWLISCVARVMEPGCKVDTVLILCGGQSKFKSTFFATLAGDWFNDGYMDIESKDAFMALRATWLFEWQELAAMQKSRTRETLKAFLTSRVDRFRPPYGHTVQDFPRSCVIVGTSNEDSFLSDPTGNRRFWPIKIEKEIDIETVRRLRVSVWGEAVAIYRSGEQWWLKPDEARDLEGVHENFVAVDPWSEDVERWINTTSTDITVASVAHDALRLEQTHVNRATEMRISSILSSLGYVRGTRKRVNGVAIRPWQVGSLDQVGSKMPSNVIPITTDPSDPT